MKEILERYGFTHKGRCQVCDGNAELYENGNVKVKIRQQRMEFIMEVNGAKVKGKSADLEKSLQTYANLQPA